MGRHVVKRGLIFPFMDGCLSGGQTGLALLFISRAPPSPPLLYISSSLLTTPFSTFKFMTRLLSDVCYFGIADGMPNPPATGGPISKAIATSSIISCRPSTGLSSLPDDILLLVVSLIGVEDILALRMVCTHDLDSTQSD